MKRIIVSLLVASMLLVSCSNKPVEISEEEKKIAEYTFNDMFIADYIKSLRNDLTSIYSPLSDEDYNRGLDSLLVKMNKITRGLFIDYVNTNYVYELDNIKDRDFRVVKSEVGLSGWGDNAFTKILMQVDVKVTNGRKLITFEFTLNDAGEISNYDIY